MELPQTLMDRIIERGAILHYTSFNDIDHGKFFVVLGVFEGRIAGFSFINSNINDNVITKQEQLDLQYPMRPCDYPFLTHLSFLCASDILKYEVAELTTGYSNGSVKVVSQMKPEHMQEILEMCRKSRIIRTADKKRFLY